MTIPEPIVDRNNLLFHLSCLARRWRQVLDAEFTSSGLTDASWRPLLHLHNLGDGMRQKDLAVSLGIEGPSLVRLLDTLMAKGLIERTKDVSDRRAKNLSLTPAGRLLVARIREVVTALEDELLAPFSDNEIARLAHTIQRLESRVQTVRSKQAKR